MSALPTVTVVVPALDEEANIGRCIAHIGRQDYPVGLLELLVVDGGSVDGTTSEAQRAIAREGLVNATVVVNGNGATPSNLNLGLARARGQILCRVDARTFIEPHYVRICAEMLDAHPDIAVVGGAQRAVAVDDHPIALGIARALNNRWTMGFARYRSGMASGPSDTVYLGAFRTTQLRGVGGWDERLPTNQDFELNRRMSRLGTVWFDSRLRSAYVPRTSLDRLWRQYRRFGRWKVRYWRLSADRPRPRQLLLLAAVPVAALVGLVGLRRAWLPTVLVGMAGSIAVEATGSDDPPGRAAAHAVSIAAIATVGLGWWSGAAQELLRPASATGRDR